MTTASVVLWDKDNEPDSLPIPQLLAPGGFCCGPGLRGWGGGGYLLAALGAWTLRRRSLRRLNDHQAGNKFLHSMEVKINGGAFLVRFRDDTAAVLEMLHILAFRESLHQASSEDSELERFRRPKRKKARAHHRRARAGGLEASDVRRLQALGAGGHFEFNRLAFVQRFVPLRLDGGKVDENVLAGLALDEPESLTGVEPLHCSLFFQCFSFSVFKLFGAARTPPAVKQKGCKCGLAAPLNESKGFTRATNANQS